MKVLIVLLILSLGSFAKASEVEVIRGDQAVLYKGLIFQALYLNGLNCKYATLGEVTYDRSHGFAGFLQVFDHTLVERNVIGDQIFITMKLKANPHKMKKRNRHYNFSHAIVTAIGDETVKTPRSIKVLFGSPINDKNGNFGVSQEIECQ